jgi:hypothetical protein
MSSPKRALPPTAISGLLEKAASWLKSAAPARPVEVGNPPARNMDRLSSTVETAAQRSENASRCHDNARRQIDSALYDLDQLRLELQSIVPADMLNAAAPEMSARPKPASDVTADPARSKRSAA